KVPAVEANIMIGVALALGTPFFIVFGWLSDKIGRKPIMLAGFALAVVSYFWIFQATTHYANPALEKALTSAPVTVVADPAECSFQLKLTNTEKYTSSCDIAKSILVSKSVNYENTAGPAGTPAEIKVGDVTIASFTGTGLSADDLKAKTAEFDKAVTDAIKAAGYPASANPDEINHVMTVIMLTILVIYVTMVYGPI